MKIRRAHANFNDMVHHYKSEHNINARVFCCAEGSLEQERGASKVLHETQKVPPRINKHPDIRAASSASLKTTTLLK
jgi:hypothetical protein